jgi:hypothetical protein
MRCSFVCCSCAPKRLSAILSLKLLTLGASVARSEFDRLMVESGRATLGLFNETSCAFNPLSSPRSTLAGDFGTAGGACLLTGDRGTSTAGSNVSGGSKANPRPLRLLVEDVALDSDPCSPAPWLAAPLFFAFCSFFSFSLASMAFSLSCSVSSSSSSSSSLSEEGMLTAFFGVVRAGRRGDGEVERPSRIRWSLLRPPGELRRASCGERGGHCG